MLRITKKVDYAILIMAYLAEHSGQACSARVIADAFVIPRAVVANLLKVLGNFELLTSQRGNRGGYRLARRPEDITLAHLVHAVEGEFSFADCSTRATDGSLGICPRSGFCPAEPAIVSVHNRIREILESITVTELAGHVRPLPIRERPVPLAARR